MLFVFRGGGNLLLELLQENAHVHPPLRVEDTDLKTHLK